jgi:cytochrome b561
VIRLQAGKLGFDSGRGQVILFSSSQSADQDKPAQPPSQWVSAILSLGVKLTTHLHLVLMSIMVELYLHGIVLNYIIKYKDNFTFFLLTFSVTKAPNISQRMFKISSAKILPYIEYNNDTVMKPMA